MASDDFARLIRRLQISGDDLLRQLTATPEVLIPDIPTLEERHEYESASDFVRRLHHLITSWEKEIPRDTQPVILAVLPNGLTVHVRGISNDGHNLVRLVGRVEHTEAMVLVHQSAVQVLCFIGKEDRKHRIGFSVDGKDLRPDSSARRSAKSSANAVHGSLAGRSKE